MLAAILTVAMFLNDIEKVTGPVSHEDLVMEKQLTEAEVVTIFNRLDIAVTSKNPQNIVTRENVDMYTTVFHDRLEKKRGVPPNHPPVGNKPRPKPRVKSKCTPD